MNCLNAVAFFNGKNVKGSVTFHQCELRSGEYNNQILVTIDLYNMNPNSIHAIHIHEYGDERKGCISLGAHWNPDNTTHGSINYDMPSHAGDMINNIYSDSNGRFKFSYFDPRITIAGNINQSIIGRSVVIHEGEDDLGLGGISPYNQKIREESLKTGNAGKRMACAGIGHAKSGRIKI